MIKKIIFCKSGLYLIICISILKNYLLLIQIYRTKNNLRISTISMNKMRNPNLTCKSKLISANTISEI